MQEFQKPGSFIGNAPITVNRGIQGAASATYRGQRIANPLDVIMDETGAPFVFDATPILLLPGGSRNYLLIQNNSAAADLWIGFKTVPQVGIGLKLLPGGFYEPWRIPQGDIYIIGSAAGFGMLIYGVLPKAK